MTDDNFEREKACYVQNFEQARSLNGQMNQVPVLAMTLTGGLWFGAGVTEDLQQEIRFGLLMFSGFCNLALIFVALRIRDVLHHYFEGIKKFHEASYVSGKPKEPKVPFGDYSMISIYCALMFIASFFSFAGSFLFFWPFCFSEWFGFFALILILLSLYLFLFKKSHLFLFKKNKSRDATMIGIEKKPNSRHESTINYYEQNAGRYFEDTHDVDMLALYQRFIRMLPEGAHILDAGSGSGRDTLAFLGYGYKVTAFDASPSLCKLSSQLTDIPTRNLCFQELDDIEKYDGIWACASLLHVREDELIGAVNRLIRALKPEGVLYMSFKHGRGERVADDGRFFTDMTFSRILKILESIDNIKLHELWLTTGEGRFHRQNEWVNVLVTKQ